MSIPIGLGASKALASRSKTASVDPPSAASPANSSLDTSAPDNSSPDNSSPDAVPPTSVTRRTSPSEIWPTAASDGSPRREPLRGERPRHEAPRRRRPGSPSASPSRPRTVKPHRRRGIRPRGTEGGVGANDPARQLPSRPSRFFPNPPKAVDRLRRADSCGRADGWATQWTDRPTPPREPSRGVQQWSEVHRGTLHAGIVAATRSLSIASVRRPRIRRTPIRAASPILHGVH